MSSAAKITKEQIKSEIDKVREEYLGVLYRIVLSLEEPARDPRMREPGGADQTGWNQFISEMYGSTADAPLERRPEGLAETRLALE